MARSRSGTSPPTHDGRPPAESYDVQWARFDNHTGAGDARRRAPADDAFHPHAHRLPCWPAVRRSARLGALARPSRRGPSRSWSGSAAARPAGCWSACRRGPEPPARSLPGDGDPDPARARRRRRSGHRTAARPLPAEGGLRADAADHRARRPARGPGATAFDVILLDLMLPGLDGLQVCRALRADAGNRPGADHHAHRQGRGTGSHRRPRARRRRLHHQAVQPERGDRAHPGAAAPRPPPRDRRQPDPVRAADGRRRSPPGEDATARR